MALLREGVQNLTPVRLALWKEYKLLDKREQTQSENDGQGGTQIWDKTYEQNSTKASHWLCFIDQLAK